PQKAPLKAQPNHIADEPSKTGDATPELKKSLEDDLWEEAQKLKTDKSAPRKKPDKSSKMPNEPSKTGDATSKLKRLADSQPLRPDQRRLKKEKDYLTALRKPPAYRNIQITPIINKDLTALCSTPAHPDIQMQLATDHDGKPANGNGETTTDTENSCSGN